MKKLVRIAVAMGMVLMMSFQTLAAPSIVLNLEQPDVSSSRGHVSVSPVGPGTYDEPLQSEVDTLNQAKADANVADAFGEYLDKVKPLPLYDSAAKNIVVEDEDLSKYYFLTPVMDMMVEGDFSAANPGDITYTLQNMTPYMDVYILYYCKEQGRWEIVPASKIEGKNATFYVHGSGPAAIIYKLKAGSGQEGQSPQTGEANVAGAFGLMAVVFAAFGVYAVKRSREEEK